MTAVLNPDFRDILSAFIDARVEFLMVGGMRWRRIACTVARPQDLVDAALLEALDGRPSS